MGRGLRMVRALAKRREQISKTTQTGPYVSLRGSEKRKLVASGMKALRSRQGRAYNKRIMLHAAKK